MASRNQVVLIGLDGLGFDEIEPLITEDELSNLNKYSTRDTRATLLSTHPPWTPCAWPTLLSGRNPGEHGVFDFFTREGYEKNLISRSSVDVPYIHEVTESQDLVPLVINYPVTHPVPNLENGAIVPGYLAEESANFHPKGLRSDFEEQHGKYVIYPDYGKTENAVSNYISVARQRRDMAQFLDKRYDWDLMAVQFQVTDSIFHDLDDKADITKVLKSVDNFVGDIIDLGGEETTVIIASDHGMGDYEWTFYINSWLAEQGYCETIMGETEYFRQQKSDLKGTKKEDYTLVKQAIGTTASTLSKIGLSPQQVHKGLSKIGLANIVETLLPEEALVEAQNQVVDHPNSQAFQLYFNSLGIHLNVEGRDPDGKVPQDEYESTRNELIEKLESIHDPDGNIVFEAVYPREEVYEGKHLEDAPDILLVPRDYQYDVSGSILDTFRRYPHKNHKPEGILLSNRELACGDEASICDIAPTVAAVLGVPVDIGTDGKVLFENTKTVQNIDWNELVGENINTQPDSNMSDVEDRLADLGYME